MTKEEAIKILTGYMGGKIDPESTELYHAIELAVDTLESQPSLPSNLDEAAEKAADEVYTYTFQHMEDLIGLFKAGAEWMAGQRETVGVKESPSKTFPRVNEFLTGASYRH